jgi:hypothetical protein
MDQDSLFIENKEPKMNLPVVIVGGSLNGLTAALLLALMSCRRLVASVEIPASTTRTTSLGNWTQSCEMPRGEGLLETYDSERRPVVDGTVAQSLARLHAWFKDPGKKLPPPEKIIDDSAVIFGQIYRSGGAHP